jgi:hypothetical protein
MSLVPLFFIGLLVLWFYMMPTITAFNRGHRSAGAICALNILLGWTMLGWIAALVWSLTSPQATQVIYVTQQPGAGDQASGTR